jgi:predicted DNA-binding transcriptional regulator AlpA
MDNQVTPVFMRPKPAAKHFGIGISTLWRWVNTRPGFPAPIKAGKAVTLIDVAATEKFLRSSVDLDHE